MHLLSHADKNKLGKVTQTVDNLQGVNKNHHANVDGGVLVACSAGDK